MDGKRLIVLAICFLVIVYVETSSLRSSESDGSPKSSDSSSEDTDMSSSSLDPTTEYSGMSFSSSVSSTGDADTSRTLDTSQSSDKTSSKSTSNSAKPILGCQPEDCAVGEFCASTCDIPKCFPCPCTIVPGQCILVKINSSFEVQCNCVGSGFFGSTCQYDVNECTVTELNTCDMNAICTNINGGFTCTCRPGYSGSGETCTLVNACLVPELNNCDENAVCSNGKTIGEVVCTCNQGYEGNGQTCEDINECETGAHSCNSRYYEVCNNLPGSFECICRDGYIQGDGPEAPCLEDTCQENNCNENAVCIVVTESYECECKEGYFGTGKGEGGCMPAQVQFNFAENIGTNHKEGSIKCFAHSVGDINLTNLLVILVTIFTSVLCLIW